MSIGASFLFHPIIAVADLDPALKPSQVLLIQCLSERIEEPASAKLSKSVISNLVKPGKQITIDGLEATEVGWQEGHDSGHLHEGIYRIKGDGKNRLIKVLSSRSRDPNREFDAYEKEYRGMLYGQEVGGPQIYRAGRIHVGPGDNKYFIEMEEKFPDQKSVTWKGFLGDDAFFLSGTPRMTKVLAHLFVTASSITSIPGGILTSSCPMGKQRG